MRRESNRVSKKWMQPIITKVLIHVRWKLNRIIDRDERMPAEMDLQVWDDLVAMRGSKASQQKLAHMRQILQGKGSNSAQMKAIEREVVGRLVSNFHVESDVRCYDVLSLCTSLFMLYHMSVRAYAPTSEFICLCFVTLKSGNSRFLVFLAYCTSLVSRGATPLQH